jgi:hypothetical protein
MDWIHLAQEKEQVGSRKHSHKPLGSIKYKKFRE